MATRERSQSPPRKLNAAFGKESKRSLFRSGSPTQITENLDKIKKNSKGGILVTPDEIQTAFEMLDPDKTGQLTLASMKKRLGILFPDMTAKELRFLMNNKKEMNLDDLKELLLENDITNYDPIADAFRVFDPEGKGSMNENRLREAFMSFGLGELSDEELTILKRTADLDVDGEITIEDFRAMLEGQPAKKHPSQTNNALSKILNL